MRKIVVLILVVFISSANAQQWSSVGKIDQQLMGKSPIRTSCIDDSNNIYVGGLANSAGSGYIAKWNGSSWSELGGFNSLKKICNASLIYASVIDKSGNLYVGGCVNSNNHYFIAKWDKATNTWSELGGTDSLKANSYINTIAIDSLGNIYTAGNFATAAGKYYVAKWNKSTNRWSELGGINSLAANGIINSVSVDASGNVYAAGEFKNASNKRYVAKWNKATNSWSELGGVNSLLVNSSILTILADSTNAIYIGGNFDDDAFTPRKYIAKWDGSSWSKVGNSIMFAQIHCIIKDTAGNLLISSKDAYVVSPSAHLYSFDKLTNNWNIFAGYSNNDYIYTISKGKNGYIYVGGAFTNPLNGTGMDYWNGVSWKELGGKNDFNCNSYISNVLADNYGNVYATGDFSNAYHYSYIAQWNGTTWGELGGGTNAIHVFAYTSGNYPLTSDSLGNIYSVVDDKDISKVVKKWNRNLNHWSTIPGLQTYKSVYSITSDKTGNLYVTGQFKNFNSHSYLEIWNGTTWQEFGGSGVVPFDITSVVVNDLGIIYALGTFTNSSGNRYVGKFDRVANTWSELGGLNALYAVTNSIYMGPMTCDRFGNLYVISGVNHDIVFKWDGISWDQLDMTSLINYNFGSSGKNINKIVTDVIGNVYITGDFINMNAQRYIAKWDGNTWKELGDSTNALNANGIIYDIATDANANVYACGDFYAPLGGIRYIPKFGDNNPIRNISGKIVTPINKNIKSVNINLSGTYNNTFLNEPNSLYKAFLKDGNYTIRPTKNNDIKKNNGVTAIDIILTQRHILNTTKLNSPYKIIAADVNNDKTVSNIDVILMKRLILGVDTTFKGNRLWAFVDSAYTFPDTTNPFPYKDSISFTNLTSNKTNQSFIGVKLGDVNYDWNPIVARGAATKPLELVVDKLRINNDELRIPISVKNFKDLTALQYTLSFNNKDYEFVGIENNKLRIEYNEQQATRNGSISFLWTDANGVEKNLEDGSEVFTLVFRGKELRIKNDELRIEEAIRNLKLEISNDITEIEAWDKNNQQHNIVLTKQTTQQEPQTPNTKQWVVSPNPNDGNIVVSLFSNTNKTVVFELSNAVGKILYSQSVEAVKGSNSFHLNLNKNCKLPSGVYFIKAIGMEGERTKRLIVK